MALITITIQDDPAGPQLAVLAEPALPRNVFEGKPSPAQALAAVMLNAVAEQIRDAGPTIIVPRGH